MRRNEGRGRKQGIVKVRIFFDGPADMLSSSPVFRRMIELVHLKHHH